MTLRVVHELDRVADLELFEVEILEIVSMKAALQSLMGLDEASSVLQKTRVNL